MVLVLLTDFSEAATTAADYITGLSRQLPVDKVILYHSIETAHMATELPLPTDAERRHLYDVSARKLEALRTLLQGQLPAGTPISTLADERPLEVSAQAVARENNADLLVMGTTHRHGLTKVLYESTASMVATSCTIPILIVPANSRYVPIKNIVYTSDLKQVATRTPVSQIRHFRALLQAQLFILNVYDEDDAGEPDEIMPQQQALHALLDEENPEIHYSGNKHVVEGIFKFIREHQIDLVVTVPRKHSFLGGLFHPSITKSLASRSNIPLLLLHPEP